jgi:hypothetical protein
MEPAAADLVEERALEPLDSKRSVTPFRYIGNVLGSLREDQVPRFFGALTDPEALPAKKVKLGELIAMQNRVDTAKVKSMAEDGVAGGKLPVVVQIDGEQWIADGHHRCCMAERRRYRGSAVQEPGAGDQRDEGVPSYGHAAVEGR